MSTIQEGVVAPVSLQERLGHIDIIRGIALLGVLVMNMHEWFRAPMLRYRLEAHPWGGWWNVGTDWLLAGLVEGKAMTTFALLFAVGLAIQMERAEERGSHYWKFGFRRLGALFALGVLHILLVWNGDILHSYALVGLLALVFLRRKLKTLLIWLGSLYGLAVVAILVISVFQILGKHPTPRSAEALAKFQSQVQEAVSVRGSGTWMAEFGFRLREWNAMFGYQGEIGLSIDLFIKFLLGLAVWKSGILRDPSAHLPRIRKCFTLTLSVGLFLALIGITWGETRGWRTSHWAQVRFLIPLMGFSQAFGMTLLALAWASGVLLLLQRAFWQRLLSPFAAMGRMALTNYLTQSLVMTWLFFGWGFGLYNKLGPLAGVSVSVGFFSLQILFSRWWLARFQFGPMEWVWRTLTYGKPQPMKKAAGVVLPMPMLESN